MPKPIKFTYEKKTPFRDAFYFIIICEGKNREPDYFRFFEGMSSRVQIVPVESGAGSAPRLLVETAIAKEAALDANAQRDQLWFVIDTDRWREQLHDIRTECNQHSHWRFNADFHPIVIETATVNAKVAYKGEGYFPAAGSTQLWELGEALIPLIKKQLDELKPVFPAPVVTA